MEIRPAHADEAVALAEILEDNGRARRFYERLGWQANGRTRAVPFPPNPLDVGYTIDLESRLATP